jgi:TM2 domain-containing membrane protein YozV
MSQPPPFGPRPTPPAYYMPPQPYQLQPMVSPRSPALATLASLFIPGLGSMISDNVGVGVLIFCLYLVSWLFSFFLIGIPFLLGFWIWGMVQAHSDAVAWNRRHGIIS